MSDIELSDDDVGLGKPKVDLSPLQAALESMTDDIHGKNADAVASSVESAVERVEELAESMVEQHQATVGALKDAVLAAATSNTDALAAAVRKIKMPDLGPFGQAVAQAIDALGERQAKALRQVASAQEKIAEALSRLADLEAREVRVELKSEKRDAVTGFHVEYDKDGDVSFVSLVHASDPPRVQSSMDAAREALDS